MSRLPEGTIRSVVYTALTQEGFRSHLVSPGLPTLLEGGSDADNP